jgi:hypothetical protein
MTAQIKARPPCGAHFTITTSPATVSVTPSAEAGIAGAAGASAARAAAVAAKARAAAGSAPRVVALARVRPARRAPRSRVAAAAERNDASILADHRQVCEKCKKSTEEYEESRRRAVVENFSRFESRNNSDAYSPPKLIRSDF